MKNVLINEKWKSIEGFPSYFISNQGNVRKDDKILKPGINQNGYYRINLFRDGKCNTRLIHRLIAKAFIPNPNPDEFTQVNHINGIKTDNSISNLEWVSPKENVNHAFRTGLFKRKMLSDEEDKIIKDLYLKGVSSSELAERFKVKKITIQKHIKGIWKERQDEIIKEINSLYNNGLSVSEIAKLLSISNPTVYKYLENNELFLKNKKSREEEIATIRELYKNGKTAEEISKELNINIHTIYSRVKGVRKKE